MYVVWGMERSMKINFAVIVAPILLVMIL
jgi:hypothetical protein